MAKPEGPQAPPIPEGAPDPQVPQQPVLHMPPLNCPHFKPEYSRKPKMQKHIYLG